MKNRGISTRTNKTGNTYEAYVMIRNNGNRSNNRFKAHVGTFKTMELAQLARLQFIDNLK